MLKYMLKVPEMYLPGINFEIKLGWLYIPVAAFVIVAMSNAVNFTDGLDGLAGIDLCHHLRRIRRDRLDPGTGLYRPVLFHHGRGAVRLLMVQRPPCPAFHGRYRSLSLGATIGVIALMTGQWALLPVIAVIPVSEALSDIIQIAYFKLTHGRRFFKMAPIHLHFELLGWSEMQIVQRFWLIGLIAAMLGIGLMLV